MKKENELLSSDYILTFSKSQFLAARCSAIIFFILAALSALNWIFSDIENGFMFLSVFMFCFSICFFITSISMKHFKVEVHGEVLVYTPIRGKVKQCRFSDIERYRYTIGRVPKLLLILKNSPNGAINIFARVNRYSKNIKRLLADLEAHNIKETRW